MLGCDARTSTTYGDPAPVLATAAGRLRWVALRVEAGRERTAAERPEAAVYEAYAPIVERRIRSRHGRRTQVRRHAMFAGYLFARLDPRDDEAWHDVHAIRGVMGIVRCAGGAVGLIPDAEIAAIRALEGERRIIAAPAAATFLAGQRVRIEDGPFMAFNGVVARVGLRGGDWVYTVEASLFGRSTPIELHAEQLSPIA